MTTGLLKMRRVQFASALGPISTLRGPGTSYELRHELGQSPNNLLDYGYAIMRAAVARAIVSAGLLPAIGIHHDSRSNSFCLADDLVEPLRPIVDHRVRDLFQSGVTTLSREAKQSLLSLLHAEVGVTQLGEPRQSHCGPLLVVLHRYLASFVECIPSIRDGQKLAIPTIKKF